MKEITSLSFKYKEEDTIYDTFKYQIKEKIFYLIHILLKQPEDKIWIQVIIISLQAMQLLAFPLHLIFRSTWKHEFIFQQISYIFQYFQLVIFLLDNTIIFYIVFYGSMIFISLMIAWFIYAAVSLSKNHFGMQWMHSILKTMLLIMTHVISLPILRILLSVLQCIPANELLRDSYHSIIVDKSSTNIVNMYLPQMVCYKNYHIIHATFSFIFTIVFICCVGFLIQTLYESKLINTSLNAKTNSIFDQMIFFNKVCLSLSFCFFGYERNQWILIALLCIFSWILFYYYFTSSHYLNYPIHVLYSIFVTVFAWVSFVLLISKLLESTSFNGGLPLFFLGIPIIIIIIFIKDIDQESILRKNMTNIQTGEEALNHIRILLYLLKVKDNSRGASIILNGYVFQYEITCRIIQCPLKRYLELINQEVELYPYFLQHIEILFGHAISAFSNCISLRIAYCYYLLEFMNKKKQAQTILETSAYYSPSIEQQFIIYRTKKLIEEYRNNNIQENEDNIDFVVNNSYKSYTDAFKDIIRKISLLYIDFWSLLLMENDDQEHLSTLNEYGSKIIILLEDLHNMFDKIQKIKPNDQEIMYYYSDFFVNILNDKEKGLSYKSKLGDIEENKLSIDDINYFNLDIDTLNSTDECQYIVISGQSEFFCTITHISLGICLLLGYSKTELIGKSSDIIMPEIYQKMHRKILIEKVNQYRKEYSLYSYINNIFQPTFHGVDTFARTKARYLIPISFKSALIVTETQGISFIAKLNPEGINNSLFLSSSCYIITNNNFLIQNFSVNSINTLGINSYVGNTSIDITNYIKEFAQEFLLLATEREDLTSEDKILLKRQIAYKRYKTPMSINWKMNELIGDPRFKSSLSNDAEAINNTLVSKKTLSQDLFQLTIQDIILGGKQEGYVFKFDPSNMIPFLGASMRISNKDLGIRRKISEKKILLTKEVKEVQFDQFKSFIPEGKAIFQLDSNQMAFMHKTKNDPLALKEELKQKALKKINYHLTNDGQDDDDNDDYTEDDNEENGSQVNSSEITSENDSIEDQAKNNIEQFQKRTFTATNNANLKYRAKTIEEDQYYKIDFTNIKLQIYSFEKKQIVEIEGYTKKSQVVIKMNEEDENPDKERKLNNPTSKKSFKKSDKSKDTDKDYMEHDDVLIKQIEYALLKEDKQQSIINLKIIMICILFLCLVFEGIWVYLISDTKDALSESFDILGNCYKVLFNFLISHAYIRDLSLISNENYTHSKTMTNEESITSIIKSLSLLYNDSQEIIKSFLTTHIHLNSNHSYLFYNETIEIAVIQDDLEVHKYNMTLLPALTEANNAIFHIITDNDKYIPTDIYVFFYLRNLNNDLCLKIENQAIVFIYQFFEMIQYKKMNFYYLLVINVIMMIGLYFLFAYIYEAVAKKKEGYLEVFFDIERNVIRSSLEKCEYFTRKMEAQTFMEFQSCDFENDNEESMLNNNKASNKKQDKHKNQKNKVSKETIIIKGVFLGFLILLNIYAAFNATFYSLFLDTLVIYMRIFLSQNAVFAEYGHLYRNTREFFFDDLIIIENIIGNEFFPKYLNTFYPVLIKKQASTIELREYFIPEYLLTYNKIYYNNLCIDELAKDEICKDVITSNITQYGLSAVLPFFVEEIRFLKNTKQLYRMISNEKGFKYNLTYTGLSQYTDLYPKDPNEHKAYFEGSPIFFFNNRIYQRIKSMFDMFLVPSFLLLFDELQKRIEEYIVINTAFFYGITCASFVIILAFYFCLWKPFETKLHSIIFKTKNMLAIIPKEVLASLENINKLLNLHQSFTKASYAVKK